ncbi:hypothetical protein jhhlp_006782 [Lomentospora prolificans]|uniref:Brix domain-containing protein n=1 Tax=Lomentospora prolificans TaxID=41688 RepID=A0A2N3N2Q7_9PEZI|nr:hypothetical protein jhhlp_006782 [Lomentospora prolificans]
MAKKRVKKRTHLGANQPKGADAAPAHASIRDPKSMVIRIGAGEVGSSISQLAMDVRRVMEPGTASRLKERKANRLRDYVTMTGPLGVTHLLLFSRSERGNVNLRVALSPKGPTLNFRVEKYSLAKDIQKTQRRPRGVGKEFTTPPLLVMNNFTSPGADSKSKVPKHLESLVTTVFQSLFPPINPQATPLKTIRRVLLLNREPDKDGEEGSFVLNFRHYAITTKTTGLSRPLRRLNAAEKLLSSKPGKKGGVPNLGKLEDIADFMIGGENGEGYMTDYTSGSEVDTDAEVEVVDEAPRRISRKAAAEGAEPEGEQEKVEKRAVKLVELGPRMKLRLTKVEDGIAAGKVMWHEYIEKTQEEMRDLEKRWEKKRQEKEARRKEQKANLEKKKAAKAKNGKDEDDDEDMGDYGSDLEPEDFYNSSDDEYKGGDGDDDVMGEDDEEE